MPLGVSIALLTAVILEYLPSPRFLFSCSAAVARVFVFVCSVFCCSDVSTCLRSEGLRTADHV